MDVTSWLTSMFGILFLNGTHSNESSLRIESSETSTKPNEILIPTWNLPLNASANLEPRFRFLRKINVTAHKILSRIKNIKGFKKYFGIPIPALKKKFPREDAKELDYAGCSPLLSAVDIPFQETLTTVYYPKCVLLERCGGCCYGPYLSCQPIEVEDVKVKVAKLYVSFDGSESSAEDITVTLQRHLTCDCQCIRKEHHCNKTIHRYDENECDCFCADKESEISCSLKSESHRWDHKACTCLCRDQWMCSTGYYFDHLDCRCKPTMPWSMQSSSVVQFNRTHG